ncbi:MAG: hypothetical protein ACLFQ8_03230 [Candidatus Aenigmatarchaeota archaeon]
MRLGHLKLRKVLTEKNRKRMFKIGVVLFFLGLLTMILSFRPHPMLSIPIKYLSITFTAAFIMIPLGALLVMISRFFYKLTYITALLVFLASMGIVAHIQMQSYRTSSMDRCCELFVEVGGCDIRELPGNFTTTVDGGEMDCTSLPPGKSVYSWRSICDC